QAQLAFFVLEKYVSTLGLSQLQGHIEHGHQNFVEHTGGVEFAGGVEKQRELLEVGGFGLDADGGNLAEKFAGGVGGGVRRIEQDVGGITRAELEAVAALQFLALDALSVDERTVLAAEVDQEKVLTLLHDLGMVAGDARVGDDQVFVDFAANIERGAIESDVPLLAALHEDQCGKYSGAGTMDAAVQGHEW